MSSASGGKGRKGVTLHQCPQLAALNTGSTVKCPPENPAAWPLASLLFLASQSRACPSMLDPTVSVTSLSWCSWRSLLGCISEQGYVPTMVGYSGQM